MRNVFILLAALTVQASPAWAQQDPFATGFNSGLGGGISSGIEGGIGSGITSGLGPPSQRTLGDAFNPNRTELGGGCAPTQVDPDHRGCRPLDWIRSEGPDANRIITYSGDSAFRPSESSGGSGAPAR
jgi:hypothetical protein